MSPIATMRWAEVCAPAGMRRKTRSAKSASRAERFILLIQDRSCALFIDHLFRQREDRVTAFQDAGYLGGCEIFSEMLFEHRLVQLRDLVQQGSGKDRHGLRVFQLFERAERA